MTLDDLKDCPTPEGWAWMPYGRNGFICRPPNLGNYITVEDLNTGFVDWYSVVAENMAEGVLIRLRCTKADLPATYRRALSVVGLAPPPEVGPRVLLEWPRFTEGLEGPWVRVTSNAVIGDHMRVGYFSPFGCDVVFVVSAGEVVTHQQHHRSGGFFVRTS